MEIVLQILIATIAAVGLGFILSDVFKIPKYPVSKAMTILGKGRKRKPILSTSGLETLQTLLRAI